MVAAVAERPAELATLAPDGALETHFHAGQWRAFTSRKRYIVVLAGTQSGKTSFGPHWLLQEIIDRGAGDYLVVTPTFPLLEVKALPEFRRLFEEQLRLGAYQGSPVRKFRISPDGERRLFGAPQETATNVYFGYADDPDSLESMTAKAAWCDESGQRKFKRSSREAIQRRLSLNQGRELHTTTPYDLGWLKQVFWDPWVAAGQNHPEIDIINFPSTANPRFPPAELDRARREMPRWKFRMFYLGQFERPAGLIYDCFDDAVGGRHVIEPFAIPDDWPRYQGADFGGVNTAGLWVAQDPAPIGHDDDGTPRHRFYVYAEYLTGNRTAKEHAAAWQANQGRPKRVVGGSKSEGQWRKEFRQAGYPIEEPDVSEVEVGINRMYGGFARDEIQVFVTCTGFREQLTTYSRVLDANGDPTEAIEEKASYHFLDAGRYIFGWLYRKPKKARIH
jgi:hypothetical protein